MSVPTSDLDADVREAAKLPARPSVKLLGTALATVGVGKNNCRAQLVARHGLGAESSWLMQGEAGEA